MKDDERVDSAAAESYAEMPEPALQPMPNPILADAEASKPPEAVDETAEFLNAFENLYCAGNDEQIPEPQANAEPDEGVADDVFTVNPDDEPPLYSEEPPQYQQAAAKVKKPKKPVNKKAVIATVLAFLFFAAAFGGVLYYTVYPAQGFFHSDSTDTIIWANASYESGRLISRDFNYAALLPTGGSLLMQPWLPVFGLSMTTHIIGMVTFVVLFTAALWFLFRSVGFAHGWCALFSSSTLLLLSGSEKLREIMWGHVIYYSLGPIYLIFILSLVLRYFKHMDATGDKAGSVIKSNIFLGLLSLVSVVAAINGFQILAIVAFPLICAVVLERAFDKSTPLWSKGSLSPLFAVVVIAIASGIGMMLLSVLSEGVVAGYADAYSKYSAIDTWKEHLLVFPEQWLTLLGVENLDGQKLFSIESVGNMIKIAFGVIIVVTPIAAVFNIRKIGNKGLRIVILSHTAMSGFVLFGYICGGLSAVNWRLTPVAITAVIVTLCYLKHLAGSTKFPRVQYGILAAVLCFACMNLFTIATYPPDYTDDKDGIHVLTASFEERGLNYGYATFWRANGITVFSDSKIKVRDVELFETGIFRRDYQSSPSWYNDQPGVDRYFLVLTEGELNVLTTTPSWPGLEAVIQEQYQVEQYTVLIFNQNVPFN